MDQKIINLFDEYTHKPLTRPDFIKRLVKITGSMAAALSILPMLEINYAQAATISENDEELLVQDIAYPSGDATVKGYLVYPKTKNKLGSVVVIHENRGLNAHIKDIARRIAKEGFIALAPDALSPFGGTPPNEDEARTLIGKLDEQKNLQYFLAAFDYLTKLPVSNGKTACIGFCWGGAMANQLAVHSPTLDAAISYYGRQAQAQDVPKIKATVQLHYGGLDERINAGIDDYKKALTDAKIPHELYIYEGAQHAFNNDTAPTRYNEAAAKLSWERVTKLLNKRIK